MIKSRLNINGTDVAFISELPISTTYSVKDIREPDKTQSAASKTISIPGTKEVIALFENCFELNVSTQSFNANLKTPADYFVNEVRVFSGSLQLLKIINTFSDNKGNYLPDVFECSILGNAGNLFLALAGKYMTDLDMSYLDHTFDVTTPITSDPKFDNSNLGIGYKYPFIDYGLTGSPILNKFKFEYLKPAIFEVTYLGKIFSNAGYTWSTGSYPDTAYAKNILTPCVKEGVLQFDSATRSLNAFRAGLTANSNTHISGSYVTFINWNFPTTTVTPIPFNDDATGDLFDGNGLFNTGTNIATVQAAAYYDVSSSLNVRITVNPPATTTNATSTGNNVVLILEIQKFNGSTWKVVGSTTQTVIIGIAGIFANPVTAVIGATATNNQCVVGDTFRTVLKVNSFNMDFRNGATMITVGTASVDFDIIGGATPIVSEFYAQINNAVLPYGGTVSVNDTIPENVTQLDFLTSIIKRENLYLEPQIDAPTVYDIYTREDFYHGISTAKDWSQKLDAGKDQEITLLGDLSAKRYVFTYKSDSDHYNDDYFKSYKEVYGTHTEDIANDFIKSDQRIELVFSPTPIAQITGKFGLCPRFWKHDDKGGVQSLALNIRCVYFKVISLLSNLEVNGVNNIITAFPYCGDVDDPYSSTPTVDLNFGTPRKLYWSFAGAKYTNNNRYNANYSKYIAEISHRDSKVVTEYFYLDEFDINSFSFRDLVFAYGAYHQVNRIIDYDPQQKKTTKVELLKLIAGTAFAPTVTDPGYYDPSGGSGSSNRVAGSGGAWGSGNQNGGAASLISGSNNMIGEGVENVTLFNCDSVSVSGQVSNVTVIGVSDRDITEDDNDTLISDQKIDAPVKTRLITISTTGQSTTIDKREYVFDASGGPLDFTLTDTGQVYMLAVKNATNTITLVPETGTINGAANLVLSTAYTKLTAVFDGTDWII
jgi:hypothetical protein